MLGDVGGLTRFGVNRLVLPPGQWSSRRHWREREDELVYVLAGEATLAEDGARAKLVAGDSAAFPKGVANGRHIINESDAPVIFLEIGSHAPADNVHYPEIDLAFDARSGAYSRKGGAPY